MYLSWYGFSSLAQGNPDPPSAWRTQLESIKSRPIISGNSSDTLRLVDYSYRGTIGSADEISAVIDKIFSDSSSILLQYFPVRVAVDSVFYEDSCRVEELSRYEFDVFTMRKFREIARLMGVEDRLSAAVEDVSGIVRVGCDVVELLWDYKGRNYRSVGIANDDRGGMIYDPVGSGSSTQTRTQAIKITSK